MKLWRVSNDCGEQWFPLRRMAIETYAELRVQYPETVVDLYETHLPPMSLAVAILNGDVWAEQVHRIVPRTAQVLDRMRNRGSA